VPLTGAVLVMERLCSLPYGMTSRELEVLRAIVAGSSNAKIARDLVVAPRTVATHVEHLLEKLGAHSRARCAAIAAAEGLILERPSGVAAHESGGWRERIGANDAAAHRRAPRVAN
jgi:DNA-binding CsgD family transcriptional regulator